MRPIRSFLVLLVIVAAACGDNTPADPATDAGSPLPDAGASCPTDRLLCAGGCVDPLTNPSHCGGCNKACGARENCEGGVCIEPNCRQTGSCPTGYHCAESGRCESGCLEDDHCKAGEVCATADRTCVCAPGTRRCVTGGECLPETTECPRPECGKDRTLCGDRCVDLWSDPFHCGGCDQKCANGEVCRGSCQPSGDCTQDGCPGLTWCDPALKVCRPGCSSSQQCDPSEQCDVPNHACVCPARNHRCDGVCVANDSVLHCGSACEPCPLDPNGRPTCDGTACGIACNSGFNLCGGKCVRDDSPVACGPSCTVCPTDPNGAPRCNAGQCEIACNAGYQLCGGRCVPVDSVDACGPSCTVCPSDPNGQRTCIAGQCGLQCFPGRRLCGGSCVACPSGGSSYTCDAQNACVVASCGSSQLLCGGQCPTCPTSGATSFACAGTQCVAAACQSGFELCQNRCASCPTIGVSGTGCSGDACVATACAGGYTLCDGSCTVCPQGGGITSTTCSGSRCVAASCDAGYKLCAGACATCPTSGVSETACNGSQCVATACASGYRPCASGCCPWQLFDMAASGSIASLTSGRMTAHVFDSNDRGHVAWYKASTKTVEYRQFDGATWHARDLGAAENSAVGLVLVNDEPHVVTHRRVSGSPSVSYIHHHQRSGGINGTWTTSNVVQQNANPYLFSGYPAIAADPSGNLTVAYWDKDFAANDSIVAMTRGASGSTWTRQATGLGALFSGPIPLVWSGGPKVLYESNYNLLLGSGPGTNWTQESVDFARPGQLAMVADHFGTLHAAYYADGHGLKYAKRAGSSWSITVVDAGEYLGGQVSIAVDPQGRPHIAYFDGRTEDLRHATFDGSNWLISVVESTGSVGWYPAIAVTSTGNPQIIYYNRTRSYLRLAWGG